jgi:hypothetical protein
MVAMGWVFGARGLAILKRTFVDALHRVIGKWLPAKNFLARLPQRGAEVLLWV